MAADPLSASPGREPAIRDRLAKRTPGQWVAEAGDGEGGCNVVTEDGRWIAKDVFGAACGDPDDAILIANAPADLQFLLSLVDSLRQDAARLESALAEADRALNIVRNALPSSTTKAEVAAAFAALSTYDRLTEYRPEATSGNASLENSHPSPAVVQGGEANGR